MAHARRAAAAGARATVRGDGDRGGLFDQGSALHPLAFIAMKTYGVHVVDERVQIVEVMDSGSCWMRSVRAASIIYVHHDAVT